MERSIFHFFDGMELYRLHDSRYRSTIQISKSLLESPENSHDTKPKQDDQPKLYM